MKAVIHDRFIINENSCWIWSGSLSSEGYGLLNISGKREYAHRVAYQLFVGPIYTSWLEIDHLCKNRACINPSHLELVTSRENSMRGNHPLFSLHRNRKCKKGHDLNIEENRKYLKKGSYRCKICDNQYARDRRRRIKECGG